MEDKNIVVFQDIVDDDDWEFDAAVVVKPVKESWFKRAWHWFFK
jgi:hypothetical protein